jgi:ABC-type sugar transport system permease subunit
VEQDTPKRASAGGLSRRRRLTAWLFMVPLLAVNLLVILGPAVATVYFSLTDWAGIGPAEFVGLENYRNLLADGSFWQALWHNVVWTILFLTVPRRIAMSCWSLLATGAIDCERIIDPVVRFDEAPSAYEEYVDRNPQQSVKLGFAFV